jgi:tRNA(Ile)-lysidine synthase
MLNKLIAFARENNLFDANNKILLAVSGGLDSSVLSYLIAQITPNFALAHCNFKLRGAESDEDQAFVRNMAEKFSVSFYTTEFATADYARQHGISIQMAARELRYNWFRSISDNEGFDRIAVAHNRNDLSETLLLNLIRGTGLKGLTGIKPIQNKLIRPLLFATRSEILEYADNHSIAYREDSSNNDNKYHRNLLRNEIIPLLLRINPALNDTLFQESEIFASTYSLYNNSLEKIRKSITHESSDLYSLSIPRILELQLTPSILFDILSPYEFSFSDINSIFSCLQAEPGKKFYSKSHVLLKDRNMLVIEKIDPDDDEAKTEYSVSEACKIIDKPIQLSFRNVQRTNDFRIPDSGNEIAVDSDKLSFPLTIRKWKDGDYFFPLGMKGKKKLSDFFIDRKINLLEKKKIWLLLSGDEIIWIMGHQISERYKIDRETKNVLVITLKN